MFNTVLLILVPILLDESSSTQLCSISDFKCDKQSCKNENALKLQGRQALIRRTVEGTSQ